MLCITCFLKIFFAFFGIFVNKKLLMLLIRLVTAFIANPIKNWFKRQRILRKGLTLNPAILTVSLVDFDLFSFLFPYYLNKTSTNLLILNHARNFNVSLSDKVYFPRLKKIILCEMISQEPKKLSKKSLRTGKRILRPSSQIGSS